MKKMESEMYQIEKSVFEPMSSVVLETLMWRMVQRHDPYWTAADGGLGTSLGCYTDSDFEWDMLELITEQHSEEELIGLCAKIASSMRGIKFKHERGDDSDSTLDNVTISLAA